MTRIGPVRCACVRAAAASLLLALLVLVAAGCAGKTAAPAMPSPEATPAPVEAPTLPPPTPAPTLEPTARIPAPELAEAADLAARSQIEDAIALYEGLTAADPENAPAEIGWAWALIYDDEPALAVTHAQRAVVLDPSSSDAYAVLSRAYAGTGYGGHAMAAALQAVTLDIGSAEARAMLGEAHLLQGETLKALRACERALELGKTNPDVHRLRAHLFLVVEKQPERAAGQLQTAAAYQPQLWLRRHELGQVLLEAGYPTVAELAFEDALALRPKAVSYGGLGEARYEQGHYDLAQEALAKAVDLGLEDARAYGYLAAAYAQLGQCDESESMAGQALALDPEQQQAIESGRVCRGMAEATESPGPTAPAAPTGATPTATRAVTALGGRIAFPVWNASSGTYEIYIAKAKDGSERSLVVTGMHQPALSPDGQWLVADGQRQGYDHLCLLKLDGTALVEITQYSEDGQPAWSPDGSRLILASFRQGVDRQPRMYSLDGIPWEGAQIGGREISTGQDAIRGEMPDWTADGQIVFRGCGLDSPQYGCHGLGLQIVPGAPQAVTPLPLTDHPGDGRPAVYGTQVAFMGNRDGDWEIYLVGLDGSGLKQLTSNTANDGLPVWSPDGKTLAFVSDRGGAWAVWAMGADGANARKLFDLEGDLGPDWTREQISWAQ